MDGVGGVVQKWGSAAAAAGFAIVPNHLLAANEFLGEQEKISPTEMVVLLQIISAWWSRDRLPYPSKSTLAKRSGLSPRQVQRALANLEKKGLVSRIARYNERARVSSIYDLSGTVRLVADLAQAHPQVFKGRQQSGKNEEGPDQ